MGQTVRCSVFTEHRTGGAIDAITDAWLPRAGNLRTCVPVPPCAPIRYVYGFKFKLAAGKGVEEQRLGVRAEPLSAM